MAKEHSLADIEQLVGSAHWHQSWPIARGVVTPGKYDPQPLFERLALPDLTGRRVLDVGTADGFYAFQCEALGAEVVAVDHKKSEFNGFLTAKKILSSKVEYVEANVYDLSPEEFGDFDLVLFLGVMYHLRHPLLALDRLRAIIRIDGAIAVESLVCDRSVYLGREQSETLAQLAPRLCDIPIVQFLPAYRFCDDGTNKWSPNVEALKAMVEDSGFRAERVEVWGDRALMWARVVEEPELDWLRTMDAGSRNVP